MSSDTPTPTPQGVVAWCRLEDRTPKDYAIEFGEYLAAAVDRLIADLESGAVELHSEDPDCEHMGVLREWVYEFRKRVRRIPRDAHR